MGKDSKGFIKLDRSIFEHWIFQDAEKFKAFVDLIQLMRWKDEKLLIGNDVILRYPNIAWIIPHCGSFLPNIYERFMGMSKILIPQKMMKEVDVEASFKNLYFDIIGNPVPYLLK